MKNLVLLSMLLSVFAMSCNTPAENVETAENNVVQANKDLDKAKANETYQAEIDNFKRETADKIAANEKSMAEFKAKLDLENKDAKADARKKITELEQKNIELKKKIDAYKVDTRDQWEIFKSNFNHEMEEIGKSFKELVSKK